MSVNLVGFAAFAAKLKDLPEKVKITADAYVQDAAKEWAQLAKRAAPKDNGQLSGNITNQPKGEMMAEVTSPVDYSAFVEWGTKTKVRIPAELQNYASQFKGTKGSGAKKFIYAWCERKGIDPKFWFIIYRSIMIKGINPHPFFFIHKPLIEQKLIGRLKKLID